MTYLAAIAPVHLVAIVLLGVVGGRDHDAASTPLHSMFSGAVAFA